MLSVSFGSDPGYLTRHVEEHSDAQRGNYYLSSVEHGEPPGQWYGPGATALGLDGEVHKPTMMRLYGDLVNPASGEALGARPYRFADTPERIAAAVAAEGGSVTPERRGEIERSVRKSHREARNYADATFSAPKSWSVLHAALESQGRSADAEQVWAAWMDGVEAGVGYLQDTAGYSRAGRHGAKVGGRTSGRWIESPNWVMSMWRHHTSRDGDPQLHVHVAILNRVECADGKWRSLDGQAIVRARPAAGAIAERVAEESLSARLGVSFAMRPDGKAREVVGITETVRDQFSARRRAISQGVAELAAAYEEAYHRRPSAYVLTLIAEHVTVDTRKAKPDHPPTRAELLDRWENQARQVLQGGLARVVEATGVDRDAEIAAETFDAGRVVDQAIFEIQQRRSTWTRHDLIAEINRQLPDCLGGLSASQTRALVDELAGAALRPGGEAIRLSAPELVPAPPELRRADGHSIYEPPNADRYVTEWHLRTEDVIVQTARRTDGPKLSVDEAERLVASSPLSANQAAAVQQVMTSGRPIDPLIGYAGVGKTFGTAEFARLWSEATNTSSLGLTTAERARQVLAEQGFDRSANIARFLAAQDRIASGHASEQDHHDYGVTAGQAIIVDEASMVTTADIDKIRAIAERADAKVVLVGDDRQLGAVAGPGGMFRLLTQEINAARIDEVRRFDSIWEREASVRLREGDVEALAEYDRRGRIVAGSRDEMVEQATRAAVTTQLRGEQSVLITGTNEFASELSSQIRAELVRLGKVEGDGTRLHDGNRAGVGDVIVTRLNEYSLTNKDGEAVTNRNRYVVERRHSDGSLTVRSADSPGSGSTQWLPADYVRANVELGYASTAHSAQGATVKVGGEVVDETTTREAFYVGASRGSQRNTIYVVTHDHLPPGEEPPDALATLGAVLERESAEQSATEVLRDETEGSESLARLEPIWADLVGKDTTERYSQELTSALGEDRARRVLDDSGAGNLMRTLRAADVAGHDVTELLARTTQREIDTAESPAAVLSWRITKEATASAPVKTSYVERTPQGEGPSSVWARQLAESMDRRVSDLGERAAVEAPQWSAALGPVPEDPAERVAWTQRASAVAGYREAYGHDAAHDPIGPAPLANAVDARTAWEAAYDALGRPEANRDITGADDAKLTSFIEAYQREEAWGPPNVDEAMRDTSLTLETWRTTVAIDRAEAERDATDGRVDPEVSERLHNQQAMVHELEADVAALDEIAQARAAWYDETAETRDRARRAEKELATRHPQRGIDDQQRDDQTTSTHYGADRANDLAGDDERSVTGATGPKEPENIEVSQPRQDHVAGDDHDVAAEPHDDQRREDARPEIVVFDENANVSGPDEGVWRPLRDAQRRSDERREQAKRDQERVEEPGRAPRREAIEADLAKARAAMAEIDVRRDSRRGDERETARAEQELRRAREQAAQRDEIIQEAGEG